MPFQNANLDGAKGTDELMIFNGRVLDRNGKIRLSTAWYWNLTGNKVRTIKPPTSFGHLVPLRWSWTSTVTTATRSSPGVRASSSSANPTSRATST